MKRSIVKIIMSVILFVGAIALVMNLQVKSNMEDMLPSDSANLEAAKDFDQYFDSQDQGIVVISNQGALPLKAFEERAIGLMESLDKALEDASYVSSVLYNVDTSQMEAYAWAYVDMEVYDELESVLDSNDPTLINAALQALENEMATEDEKRYLVSEDGHHYMMMIKPMMDGDNFDESRMTFYNGLKSEIDALESNETYMGIDVGITGGAFIQDIEGDTVAFQGMDKTLIVTLLCIVVVVALFFGGLKLPLLSLYPLVLGALLASAAAYLIYGSINMFTVSFAMLLLGLGIDFAVHLIARYQEGRASGIGIDKAIHIARQSTGSSIMIGAATTAFAFATFSIARFKAFSQMGIISAIGIVFLCVSMIVLIPALIKVFDRSEVKKQGKQLSFSWLECYVSWIIKHPIAIVTLIFVVCGVLYTSVMSMEVESDVSAIYPKNIPSLAYAEVLEESFDYNSNTVSVYFDDMASLEKGVSKLEEMNSVLAVESILDYMPEDQEVKLERAMSIEKFLHSIGASLGKEMILEPLTYEKMPTTIKEVYVGRSNKLLVEIIPRDNIYNKENCNRLIDDILSATGKRPIGIAVIMNEITDLVTADVLLISILCLSSIGLIALIAFRNIRYALLTIMPILVTLYITLGLLPIVNVEVNLFSVASFPLIIGIGVDSGIHLIHRLKEGDNTSMPILVKETGKAIILTALTTMIGFGSLASINHPGMKSFGLVVVVGMAVNLVLTLTIIPIGMQRIQVKSEKKTKVGGCTRVPTGL